MGWDLGDPARLSCQLDTRQEAAGRCYAEALVSTKVACGTEAAPTRGNWALKKVSICCGSAVDKERIRGPGVAQFIPTTITSCIIRADGLYR